ncbi:PREDICTED: EKC/KEOPS complex subunit Tprkb-like [Wasmannia auropunctata]|uniref:EKC/KEOPS complex subunit Tprkb-like n=1 Tax=Wasmannia auropunctata TaxID=64793 RepID=UPI0005EEF5DD|nr:PREDICTED: EKC/KEOPS complex subunit Tprkb-like [Wasmannia auropunctata]
MDDHSAELDEETEFYYTLCLFANVENTSEIREKLVAGELRCCVVKASLITDALQAVVAANKAALNATRNRLITRTVYTEILFYLSMSKNISRSLSEFGISDSDRNILVILMHKLGERQAMLDEVLGSVKGERMPISRLPEFTDVNLVKKTYKIDEDELRVSSLADAVVSRISCKEFILPK